MTIACERSAVCSRNQREVSLQNGLWHLMVKRFFYLSSETGRKPVNARKHVQPRTELNYYWSQMNSEMREMKWQEQTAYRHTNVIFGEQSIERLGENTNLYFYDCDRPIEVKWDIFEKMSPDPLDQHFGWWRSTGREFVSLAVSPTLFLSLLSVSIYIIHNLI